jgi:hypothetical protein
MDVTHAKKKIGLEGNYHLEERPRMWRGKLRVGRSFALYTECERGKKNPPRLGSMILLPEGSCLSVGSVWDWDGDGDTWHGLGRSDRTGLEP